MAKHIAGRNIQGDMREGEREGEEGERRTKERQKDIKRERERERERERQSLPRFVCLFGLSIISKVYAK